MIEENVRYLYIIVIKRDILSDPGRLPPTAYVIAI